MLLYQTTEYVLHDQTESTVPKVDGDLDNPDGHPVDDVHVAARSVLLRLSRDLKDLHILLLPLAGRQTSDPARARPR